MAADKPKLVSLFANWYSGATLFTMLLNGHSQVVSNGESMFFDDKDERRYDCSCGQYIDECEFYRSTAGHMRLPGPSGWDKRLFVHVPAFSKNRLLRSFLRSWRYEGNLREYVINAVPTYRGVKERFLDAQLRFFANARERVGGSIYMDGTKSIRRAQLFARHAEVGGNAIEMKVLHLIRDGRGFAYSYLKNENSRRTPRQAADTWLRYIAQVDKFSKTFLSVPVLTVRYEDFCRSTAETADRICKFLGIPYEDFVQGTTDDVHVLGHEMRRTFNGSIREDTSWKDKLDRDTQDKLRSLMKRQLERFGYL